MLKAEQRKTGSSGGFGEINRLTIDEKLSMNIRNKRQMTLRLNQVSYIEPSGHFLVTRSSPQVRFTLKQLGALRRTRKK